MIQHNRQGVVTLHSGNDVCDDCSPELAAKIKARAVTRADRAFDLEGARAVDRVMARRAVTPSADLEPGDFEQRRKATMAHIRSTNYGTAPSRKSPELISRMSERDVYDLSRVRTDPMNRDALRGELVDRARRANDLSHYPTAGRDQERVQTHIDDLLRRSDSEQWNGTEVAHRILATGSEAYRRAFAKTMIFQLRGTAGPILTPEETQAVKIVQQMRAMGLATGAQGAFAVPFVLDATLVPTSAGSRNPYRQVCRVEQISGSNEWRQATSGAMTASYVSEATVATDQSPTLAQKTLTTVRAQAFAPVSLELAEDWGAINDQLGQLILSARDDLETTKFTLGTGTNEPEGLITGATTATSPATQAFGRDGLYTVSKELPARFRSNAAWFGNKVVYDEFLKLVNTGASIWLPLPDSKISNTGYSLANYPANEVSAMTSAITTTNKVLVIADTSYYTIVDRIGLDLEVTTWLSQQAIFGAGTSLPTGQRGILALWRNTARLLDPAAARVFTVT
jgi:HK97 family phage major capsid protein